MIHHPARLHALVLVPAALAVSLAGGPAALATDDDVATLGSPAPRAEASAGPGEGTVDPEEAMLAYARCMREHGIDMPDPQFTGGGGVVISTGGIASVDGGSEGDDDGAVSVLPLDDPAFQAASEACDPLLQAGLPPIDPELRAEMQAQALAFARCMRDHGVDMPDPQFTDDGGVTMSIGGTAGEVDVSSADVQEAQSACGDGMGFGVTSVEAPGGGDAGADVP